MQAKRLVQSSQSALLKRCRVSQLRWLSHTTSRKSPSQTRRSTLSSIWVPTGLIVETPGESGHEKLLRAGFLRQSQSGIFHMLPLGVRVQEKLERLLDEQMQAIGASKVSMSSITSAALWKKSGRLDRVSSELFQLRDRKDVPLMLSPTHEEEITSVVASTLKSYKDLPIKLYQISRKYRDEIRPRHGLLRSREFIMKDLYTFDITSESAVASYHQVAAAYKATFDKLKLPIIVAEASSGDMGGEHSHEYHLAHPIGSDTVLTCDGCHYAANDEVAVSRPLPPMDMSQDHASEIQVWRGVSRDRKTLVNVWYHTGGQGNPLRQVNIHAVKSMVPDLDTTITALSDSVESEDTKKAARVSKVLDLVDSSLPASFDRSIPAPHILDEAMAKDVEHVTITTGNDGTSLSLLSLADGDGCPRCETGSLRVQKALELGHTFYLGTRYSNPLEAKVALPQAPKKQVPLEMGCYGIGISRIFGAVAEHLMDDRGLNWPRVIAPFEVVVIPTSGVTEDTLNFFDALTRKDESGAQLDAVLDDRKQGFGWKMQDAETTGYPVSIILGKEWKEKGLAEVQCRRLSLKEKVSARDIVPYVQDVLSKL